MAPHVHHNQYVRLFCKQCTRRGTCWHQTVSQHLTLNTNGFHYPSSHFMHRTYSCSTGKEWKACCSINILRHAWSGPEKHKTWMLNAHPAEYLAGHAFRSPSALRLHRLGALSHLLRFAPAELASAAALACAAKMAACEEPARAQHPHITTSRACYAELLMDFLRRRHAASGLPSGSRCAACLGRCRAGQPQYSWECIMQGVCGHGLCAPMLSPPGGFLGTSVAPVRNCVGAPALRAARRRCVSASHSLASLYWQIQQRAPKAA